MTDTLFMIHGMFCGAWAWDNYRQYFSAKGYRCIAPTLRHHDVQPGERPSRLLGTTGLLEYADDLENEIRRLDEAPILVGHSMGALLTQILAGRGFGKAAVLLTPASPAGIMALKVSVIRSFWNPLTRWGFWKKPMRLSFKSAEYAVLNRMPPDERKEVYSHFVCESGRAGAEIGFWFFDPKQATRVEASQVTCPMLVAGCTHDRITPAPVVRKVAEKYSPVSDYIEFKDHAHWVFAEPGWQDIAAYIDNWIKSQSLQAGHMKTDTGPSP